MNVISLFMRYQSDMKAVEQALLDVFGQEKTTLKESATHLLKAGGKRLRPMLALLGARFGNRQSSDVLNIAVPLELIHMATLVHDDVIDEARTRRGQLTVMAKWDARTAMYTGDFIFAHALRIACTIRNPQLHQILSLSIVHMCRGEFAQMRRFFDLNQPLIEYWRRIKRKTALLIAVSCQLGSMAAGADEVVSSLLYQIGYDIGMAFQIMDDLLDLTGTEKQIGKPPGNDLKQGNLTLPVLLALRMPNLRESLISGIAVIKETQSPSAIKQVIEIIKTSGTIETSREIAERVIARALSRIAQLPAQKERDDLIHLANFVINRSN